MLISKVINNGLTGYKLIVHIVVNYLLTGGMVLYFLESPGAVVADGQFIFFDCLMEELCLWG